MTTTSRAEEVVSKVLLAVEGSADAAPAIVASLDKEGLLARCICPTGFGQVANPNCRVHPDAPHTITGVGDNQ